MLPHRAPFGSVAVALVGGAALVFGLAVTALIGGGAASAAPNRPTTVRLVAGGGVVDRAGQHWSSDAAYASGGAITTTRHPIAGTRDQVLFRTQRYGVSGYRVPVRSGTYAVVINLTESSFSRPGQRIFGLSGEGVTPAKALDIAAEVGRYRAYQLRFTVPVTGDLFTLNFSRLVNLPTISSLSLVRTGGSATGTAPRVTAAVTASIPLPTVSTSTPPVSLPATTPAVTNPSASTPSGSFSGTSTSSASSPPPSAAIVSPESFGARADGVTDDTVALQRAFDSAPAGSVVLLASGRTYRHSDLLYLRTAGLHVSGAGELLATNQGRSSVWIEADNVLLDGGLKIATAGTTQRWSAWEQMGVRIYGHSGVTLRDITVSGSAAAGIYVGNAATGFVLDHDTVENTRADGIHLTMGANHGQVIAPTISNTGDDGVAVVSYQSDGVICHDITVTAPHILSTAWGRGLSVVGGTNITETDINVANTDAAAVYIASEGSPWYTYAPTNVIISGGTITGANADPTIDHGAVVVLAGETGPTPAHITVQGLRISSTRASASRDFGVITYGTAPNSVLFQNLVITGGPISAYSGNTPQSSYQIRNVTQNGVTIPNAG